MKLKYLSLAILLIAVASVMVAQEPNLSVVKSLTLTTALDGFEGQLELLEDARITPDLEKTLWGSGGPEMALDKSDPLYKNLTSTPLRNAVLRLRNAHRKIVAEQILDREQARIRFERLREGRRTILVTTDLSAGFGSYAGPFTDLLDIDRYRLESVTAQNSETGLSEPIHLISTLKTAWELAPVAGGQKNQKDILEVACRPDFDAKETTFYVTYTRYHWDGKGWIVLTRKVHGFWEGDNEFPAQVLFPSATKRK